MSLQRARSYQSEGDWCDGAGRGANETGGCTYCTFQGRPTKNWVVRPHKVRTTGGAS